MDFCTKPGKPGKTPKNSGFGGFLAKTPIQTLWKSAVLAVLTVRYRNDTTGPDGLTKGSKTPIQIPWEVSKMSVFHEILVKKDTFRDIRSVGDILEKNAKKHTFSCFSLKFTTFLKVNGKT